MKKLFLKMYIVDIIHIEGILCGLSVKYLYIRGGILNGCKIPIFIIGYNRKYGKSLQRTVEKINAYPHKEDGGNK